MCEDNIPRNILRLRTSGWVKNSLSNRYSQRYVDPLVLKRSFTPFRLTEKGGVITLTLLTAPQEVPGLT